MMKFQKPVNLQAALREAGYFASDEMARKIWLALRYRGKGLSTVMLDGAAGSGKTFLVETLAHIMGAKLEYYQCVATTSEEALVGDIDVSAVVARDSSRALRKGKLVRAIENTVDGLSFLFIDELDKARPEIDAFLLDFLQSGRLTGTPFGDLHVASTDNIIVFLAKNDERDVSEPLARRCRYIHVEMPTPRLVLDVLTKRVPNADKAMVTWIVKLYAVMLANMANLRKVMTIQEMENALLDDLELKDLSTEERLENAIAWAAQFEDDLTLVREWASKIPFGATEVKIKESGQKSVILVGSAAAGHKSEPDDDLLSRVEALEAQIYGDNGDEYDDDDDEYRPDPDVNVANLLYGEGDYIGYEGRCMKIHKLRPNGQYIELTIEDVVTGRINTITYVDPDTVEKWEGEIPKFQGFLSPPELKVKPVLADESEINGIPAGTLTLQDGELVRNDEDVQLIADNVFQVGHYTAWRRAEGWQLMWDGQSIEDYIEIQLLEKTQGALFSVDISWVKVDRRQLASRWEGRLAIYGKDGFVVIPGLQNDLGDIPERVLVTDDVMTIKMKDGIAPKGIGKFIGFFDAVKNGKFVPEWDVDTKETKIGNWIVELKPVLADKVTNELIDVYEYKDFVGYDIIPLYSIKKAVEETDGGTGIISTSRSEVEARIDRYKDEWGNKEVRIEDSGVVSEYGREYTVISWTTKK